MKKKITLIIVFATILLGQAKANNNTIKAIQENKNIFHTDVFIENKGQYNTFLTNGSEVKYCVDHFGPKIYFTSSGITYQYNHMIESNAEEVMEEIEEKKGKEKEELLERLKHNVESFNYEMKWLDANKDVQIVANQKTSNYYSYGDVNTLSYGYGRVRYVDLYPNIDVEYTIDADKGIKYTIYAKAGADLSKVKFAYINPETKIQLKDGALNITFGSDKIEEQAPISFYSNNEMLACEFVVNDGVVSFMFPGGYDASKDIVIDPWIIPVSTLVGSTFTNNKGFDVDFDFDGNLYVFGGGSNSPVIDSRESKYTVAGALMWTFMGSLTVPFAWTAQAGYGYIGNFVVDKSNGKSYLSQGFNATACEVIRITDLGVSDGWRNIPSSALNEGWELFYDCRTNAVLITGGSTASNQIISTLNPISGAMTLSSFTGIAGGFQDILHSVSDRSGNVFVILASQSVFAVDNHMYRLNPGYGSFMWNVMSGYLSFREADNRPYYSSDGSNGFNALAVNDSFLYYYDGLNLKAFNKSTGAGVGTPLSIPGHTVKAQGGISVDDCNHVYVGGNNGNIKVYTFTGTSFVAGSDIIIPGYSGRGVYDIRYNQNNNFLYATGNGFVSIIDPPFICTTTSLRDTITLFCNKRASVQILVPDSAATYSYIWQDTLTGVVVRSTYDTPLTSDTLSGMIPGRYYLLTVVKNLICGGVRTTHFISIYADSVIARITICTGDTVRIGSSRYTTAGVYTDTTLTFYNCEVINITTVLIGPLFIFTQNISTCPGVTTRVGPSSYSTAGTYRDTFVRGGGRCDSVVVTNLTIRATSSSTNPVRICPGGYVVVGSNVYTLAGSYVDTFRNFTGCDSVLTTVLIADTVPIHRQNFTICESGTGISVGSSYYTTSGTFTDLISRGGACDSTVVTTIIMTSASRLTLSFGICLGDTVRVGARIFTLAGTYRDTFDNYLFCDSFITTTVFYSSAIPTHTQVVRLCSGRSLLINGHVYTTGGTYRDTIDRPGCDSVLISIVVMDPSTARTQNLRICSGRSVTVGLRTYSVAGSYRDTLISVIGCDSIVTTNLTLDTMPMSVTNVIRCDSVPYVFNSHTYTVSGTYLDTILRSGGLCDSLVTTNLSYGPLSNITQNIQFCIGNTLSVGVRTYSTSGTYRDTLINVGGCDSIIVSNLTVNPISTNSLSFVRCFGDSLFAQGAWRSVSGIYFDTLVNYLSCDSILTTNITIIPLATSIRNITICFGTSYVCGGSAQSTSGSYYDTLISYTTCDSILRTNLTVSPILQGTLSVTICLGNSYFCEGASQFASGIFYDSLSNSNGCDSVLRTNLTVNPLLQGVRNINICNGEFYFCEGANRFTSGVFYDSLSNSSGCDSVIRTNLAVNPQTYLTRTINRCVGQVFFCGGANQSTSGTYFDTLINIYNCDSVLTTNLIINPLPFIDAGNDTTICRTERARLTAVGVGSLLWTGGFTTTSIFVSPIFTTQYMVTITDANGCVSRDSVTVNINQLPVINVRDTSICSGFPALLSASGATSYLWRFPDGTTSVLNPVIVNPTQTSSYTVVGTDLNNCRDSLIQVINIVPASVIIVPVPDSIIRRGTELSLFANLLNVGDSILSWRPAASVTSTTSNPTSSNPSISQWYYITTVNSTGCIANDSIFIEVLPVDDIIAPTGFSPNGDGVNDVFRLVMTPYLELEAFIVVNRWGEEVFNFPDFQKGKAWDGMFKDREQPISTYVWYAVANSKLTGKKTSKSGNITLLR